MKKKKHKVKHIRVRRADSGGYIAHHMDPSDAETGAAMPEQEHVVPDLEALKAHLGDHLGEPDAGPVTPQPQGGMPQGS